jgi:hypothetical protein
MRSYGSLLLLLSLPNLDYPGGNLSSCKDNPATLGAATTRKYEVFVSPSVTRVSQPPTYVAGRRDLSPPQINAAASRRINSAAKDRKLDVFFDGPGGHQRTSQVYSAVWAPLVAPSHIVAAATPPHLVPPMAALTCGGCISRHNMFGATRSVWPIKAAQNYVLAADIGHHFVAPKHGRRRTYGGITAALHVVRAASIAAIGAAAD